MDPYLQQNAAASRWLHTKIGQPTEEFHREFPNYTTYRFWPQTTLALALGTLHQTHYASHSVLPLLTVWVGYQLGDLYNTVHFEAHRRLQHGREHWETVNYLEGELAEMEDIYQKGYGISKEVGRPQLEAMVGCPSLFVDHMMVFELGLLPPRIAHTQTLPLSRRLLSMAALLFPICVARMADPWTMRGLVTLVGGAICYQETSLPTRLGSSLLCLCSYALTIGMGLGIGLL